MKLLKRTTILLVGTVLIAACGDDKGSGSIDSIAPAPITDLQTGAKSKTTMVLGWTVTGDDTTSGNASQFDIRYSRDSITEATFANAPVAQRDFTSSAKNGELASFLVENLESFTTYYFAVKAGDEVPNWSTISNVAQGQTDSTDDQTPPAAVSNLEAINITPFGLTLRWTAPGDDSVFGKAAIYQLKYSEAQITVSNFGSGNVFPVPNVGQPKPAGDTETVVMADVLRENTTYYFMMRTGDERPDSCRCRWSALSNLASARTTTAEKVPPETIDDLTAETIGGLGIRLRWTAPGDDGNVGTAKSYEIRYSDEVLARDIDWEDARRFGTPPVPRPAGTAELVDVTGLASDKTYYFRIRATDESKNKSSFSNTPSAVAPDLEEPAPIFTLDAVDSTSNSIKLQWQAPGDNGNTGQAVSYDIRYAQFVITAANFVTAIQVANPPAPFLGGNQQNYTVTGLKRNTAYWFAIKTADEVPNISLISNVAAGHTAE